MIKNVALGFFAVMLILLVSGCVHQSTEIKLTSEQKQENAKQSAIIHTELSAQYYSRGQNKIAIDEANIAIRANSEYALAYNMLGVIYMALEQNDLAHDNFGKALRFSSKQAEINNNYGWFLCQVSSEKIDQAIKHFRVALSDPLYETPEKAYANMGVCELKRHNYAAAVESFQQTLLISSMDSIALVGLIEVDYRQGHIAEASAKLARFNAHSAPTPKSLIISLLIAQAMGDRQAEDSYKFQLQKNFPGSKEAYNLRQGRMK